MNGKISLLLGAFAGMVGSAEASTFTPDMWVYEVTYSLSSVDISPDAYFLPTECIVEGVPGASTCDFLEVPRDTNLEISLDPSFAQTFTSRIGFNSSNIICTFDFLGWCPSDPDDDGNGFETMFYDVSLDAAVGRLSFCSQGPGGGDAGCYEFSREGVTGRAADARNDTVFGTLPEGQWFATIDTVLWYGVSGRLVSEPAVIPVPASFLMLGSAFALFGVIGLRRNAGASGGLSS